MGNIEHSRDDLKEVRTALDDFSNKLDWAVFQLNRYLKDHFHARADVLQGVVQPAENAANAAYRLASVLSDRLEDLGVQSDSVVPDQG